MSKKIVIAGLVMALLIEKLRHIEEGKKRKLPKMMISEVDAMLYHFNLSPEHRVMFKSVLVHKEIMEERYTELENPWPRRNLY